MEIDCDPSQF